MLTKSHHVFLRFLLVAVLGAGSLTGLYAQTVLKGTVYDEQENPLPWVSIAEKAAKNSRNTVSDADGKFTVTAVNKLPVTLVFTYLGFKTQEIDIYDDEPFTVVLAEDNRLLAEVVVTALGISREKKSLGYTTQELKSEALEGNKETNLLNALAGKAAGVRITNSQGDMGSSRIVIRGETSIAGNNQPLFIVDGVPVDNSQLNRGGATRDFRNAVADLNPEDIESMSILKGPNAAALYGSRAAHGVVLITTKSGKGQRGLGVSVHSGVTFAKVATLPEFQDVFGQGAEGKFSYVNGKGGGVNDGVDESWGPKMDGSLIPQFHSNGIAVPFEAHPNNVRDFFETGTTFDNGISISGSDDKHDFRLGVNHQDQNGTVPNTEIKKTNFSLNANYQLTKRIKAGASVNYILTDAPNLPGGSLGQRAAGVMLQFLWFGRQVDMARLKEDWSNNWNHSYYSNPYWRAYYNTVQQKRNRIIGDVHFEVNILDGLDFKFRSGTDYYNDRRKYKIKTGTNGTPDGSYAEDAYTIGENNTEALLSYTRALTNDFHLDVLGGFNIRNQQYENNYQKATKLAAPDLFTLSNSKDPLESTNDYKRLRVYSGFASAQFGYKGYAYLNLTARNDWSSTLPRSNRSYFYPSANASVVVSEWLGLQSDVLSFLKVRGGWSEVGNDADPYQLATVYNIQTAFEGNPILTSSKEKNNPDLKPETTYSTELGAELGLFKNRIHFDAAFYNTNSIDQILKVQTTTASGYSSQLINAGKVNNKGVELQLNVIPVQTKTFKWDLGLNYAANSSKVVELDKEGLIKNYTIGSQGVQVLASVGERYGILFGTSYKRDNSGTIIVDDNGRPKLDPNNKILGHYTPDWVGGFSNSFTYKNIDLSFLIDASIGGSIYSGTNQTADYAGVSKQTLPGRDAAHGGLTYQTVEKSGETVTHDDGMIFQGITEDGKANTVVLSAENYYKSLYSINEAHVYDASYVKLREIKLTYNFDRKLIRRIGLEGASISAVARNVAFLYKDAPNIDPEAALGTGNLQGVETLSLPTTHSYGFSVNLKF
ncbi:Enterobactin outer-membrane receptor [Bacteroidales bacterium Barb6XT]|nr:Enterobactin outer-membrane receptor [Bacteroidales bacterium Barb6XT]